MTPTISQGVKFSAPAETLLELVHVGVPQHDQKGVRRGWPKHSWKPWQKYLGPEKKK
jgi:hypothetical protein